MLNKPRENFVLWSLVLFIANTFESITKDNIQFRILKFMLPQLRLMY